MEQSPKRVIFTSFSFKSEVEDLRNSPYLAIADILKNDYEITVVKAVPGQTFRSGDVIIDAHGEYSWSEQDHPAKLIRLEF